MMVGMVAALLVYGMVDTTSAALRRDKDVAAVLAQAKQALIGRAVADDTRPGSLPCPDIDDDGSAELFAGTDCPSYIGRLPWRTLGLPDLRDAAGERLWYALSNNFRDEMAAGTLNSDTKGNRTVYSETTAVTLTSEAVAVIFAPGPVLPGQVRDAAGKNNPANYLDATGGANNSIAAGPFVSAQSSGAFNDKLLVITTANLIPVVEMRVAREMLALLNLYRNAGGNTCACYTWGDNDFNNEGDDDVFRGWLPLNEGDPHLWGPPPADPGPPVNLGITVPAWLNQNQWWKVVYYALAPIESQNKSGGTLTVDGASGTHVVLITPGPPPPGVSRPLNAPGSAAYWAEYLQDAENADHSNNVYVRPTSTAYARNRLYTIP